MTLNDDRIMFRKPLSVSSLFLSSENTGLKPASVHRGVTGALEGIPLTTEVTAGRAFAEILRHARDWSADLIVLGAKGTASLGQIVVGSTAKHVMKDAPCSVLIVK